MRYLSICALTLVLLLGMGGCKSSEKGDAESSTSASQVTYKCNSPGCDKTKTAPAGTAAPS
ncbi:MAG: hypothetical protein JRG94_06995 [Deltaproteobacteria bacterium]|nr:hypothetical protein [Deltaproteobacteria bacterium]